MCVSLYECQLQQHRLSDLLHVHSASSHSSSTFFFKPISIGAHWSVSQVLLNFSSQTGDMAYMSFKHWCTFSPLILIGRGYYLKTFGSVFTWTIKYLDRMGGEIQCPKAFQQEHSTLFFRYQQAVNYLIWGLLFQFHCFTSAAWFVCWRCDLSPVYKTNIFSRLCLYILGFLVPHLDH